MGTEASITRTRGGGGWDEGRWAAQERKEEEQLARTNSANCSSSSSRSAHPPPLVPLTLILLLPRFRTRCPTSRTSGAPQGFNDGRAGTMTRPRACESIPCRIPLIPSHPLASTPCTAPSFPVHSAFLPRMFAVLPAVAFHPQTHTHRMPHSACSVASLQSSPSSSEPCTTCHSLIPAWHCSRSSRLREQPPCCSFFIAPSLSSLSSTHFNASVAQLHCFLRSACFPWHSHPLVGASSPGWSYRCACRYRPAISRVVLCRCTVSCLRHVMQCRRRVVRVVSRWCALHHVVSCSLVPMRVSSRGVPCRDALHRVSCARSMPASHAVSLPKSPFPSSFLTPAFAWVLPVWSPSHPLSHPPFTFLLCNPYSRPSRFQSPCCHRCHKTTH